MLDVFTIADGNYELGAVALVESLLANGFRGKIYVATSTPSTPLLGRYECVTQIVLGEREYCSTNLKAEVLLKHATGKFLFIDADCVVDNAAFIPLVEAVVDERLLLCIEAVLPSSDLRRYRWTDADGKSHRANESYNFYFNAGLFAGSIQRDGKLLEQWDRSIKILLKPPGQPLLDQNYKMADQDVLNKVVSEAGYDHLTISPPDVFYSRLPTENFFQLGYFSTPAVLHGTGSPKPWQMQRVPTRRPDRYERRWLHYFEASGTQVPVPKSVVAWMRGGLRSRALSEASALKTFAGNVLDRVS